MALGITGVVSVTFLHRKEVRQFLMNSFAQVKSAISSSEEENSQLVEQTTSSQGTGQTKTRKLLILFGTLLVPIILLICNNAESDVSMDIPIEETPSPPRWRPIWISKHLETIRLVSVLITLFGLLWPVPGPVGVPLTPFEEFFVILKRVAQIVGHTGVTLQDD